MRRSTPKIEPNFSRIATVALIILDLPVFKIKSTGRVHLLVRRRGLLHVKNNNPTSSWFLLELYSSPNAVASEGTSLSFLFSLVSTGLRVSALLCSFLVLTESWSTDY